MDPKSIVSGTEKLTDGASLKFLDAYNKDGGSLLDRIITGW